MMPTPSIQSPDIMNLAQLQAQAQAPPPPLVSTGLKLAFEDGDQFAEQDLLSLVNNQKDEIEQYLVAQVPEITILPSPPSSPRSLDFFFLMEGEPVLFSAGRAAEAHVSGEDAEPLPCAAGRSGGAAEGEGRRAGPGGSENRRFTEPNRAGEDRDADVAGEGDGGPSDRGLPPGPNPAGPSEAEGVRRFVGRGCGVGPFGSGPGRGVGEGGGVSGLSRFARFGRAAAVSAFVSLLGL